MPSALRTPPTPPDPAAQRLIDAIAGYVTDTTLPGTTRAAGARHIAIAARDLADDAAGIAHDEGATWPEVAGSLGMGTGSVNRLRHRADARRTRRSPTEATG